MNKDTMEQPEKEFRLPGISNKLPEMLIKIEHERRARMYTLRFVKVLFTLLILLASIFLLASCKTHIATNYLIKCNNNNYYTEKYAFTSDKKDSIILFEKKRNGMPKNATKIPLKDAVIIDKH